MSDERCPVCKGDGWTVGMDHAPMSTHDGRDGSCTICPVPVQEPCTACNATGKVKGGAV